MNDVDRIRAVVDARQPTDDIYVVMVTVQVRNTCAKLTLLIDWWPQYRVYRAVPVEVVDGTWTYVYLRYPEYWYRGLKRMVRDWFGIRHMHHVNNKDNSQRITALLRVQTLPVIQRR